MKLRRSLTALTLTGAVALGGLAASTAPAHAVTAPVGSWSAWREHAATCRGIATHIEAMKDFIEANPDNPYIGLWYASITYQQSEYRRLGCERYAPVP